MDAEFQSRWPDAKPPFDGDTLFTAGMAFAAVRNALIAAIQIIRESGIIKAGEKIYRLDDWHEHDGILLEAHTITWGDVESWLASEKSLRLACPGDTFVRAGIFTEQRLFYLRFGADEGDPDSWLDLSGPAALLKTVQDRLNGEPSVVVKVEPAQRFFAEGYKGY